MRPPAFLLAVLSLVAVSSAYAADLEVKLPHGGRARSYLLHVPDILPSGPRSLVVVLHGSDGNAWEARRISGMDSEADREGFIVAYPNGTGDDSYALSWNAGNCCEPAVGDGIDDVAFVRAVIADISRKQSVDAARVYAVGFSNGASLTYHLACHAADVFAAIAPVSGSIEVPDCSPTDPVSVIIFHGTDDENVNYNGGIARHAIYGRTDTTVFDAVTFWVRANGCDPEPSKSILGNTVRHTFGKGKEDSEVVLYTLFGHAHSWPHPGDIAGMPAAGLIWDFFERHPRRK